jgi:hypothetical protein
VGKILDTYDHPKLSHDDINHLNRSITCNEIEAAMMSLPRMESPGPDMILYLKDLKNCTKSHLDITNGFSKVAGYKINLQNPGAFLYINNEQTEKEYKKTIPFTIALKNSQVPRTKPS